MSDSKIAKDLIRPDDGTGKATTEMKIENLALSRCVAHLIKPKARTTSHPSLIFLALATTWWIVNYYFALSDK